MNKNIAILASGEGTNAEQIIRYFQGNGEIRIALLVSNRENAGALRRAEQLGVKTCHLPKVQFQDPDIPLALLHEHRIDFIVLAGFLLFVPVPVLKAYANRIVNIHPALLPKFGGQGMYGDRVHEAVLQGKETESGITIHYANEHYDEGKIIFQAQTPVFPDDTPHSLAGRIHELEHRHYPQVIEQIVRALPQ